MSLTKILDVFERKHSGNFTQISLEEQGPSELNAFHTRYRVKIAMFKSYKSEDAARKAFRTAIGKAKSYNEQNRLN